MGQRGDMIGGAGLVDAQAAGDVVGGVELEAVREHGQPQEDLLLGGDRASGTTTRWWPAWCCAARSTPRRRPLRSMLNRSSRRVERPRAPRASPPGRGQLDGQRDAVEPAHRCARSRSDWPWPRVGACGHGPLLEQLDRVVAGSSDRTATTCSPSMPSASRLVAIRSRGRPPSGRRSPPRPGRRRARSCRPAAAVLRRQHGRRRRQSGRSAPRDRGCERPHRRPRRGRPRWPARRTTPRRSPRAARRRPGWRAASCRRPRRP